ncbi:uncharacterized protein LOC126834847 [Adelges cooleyi]|uniref:uncharacterized protein LOC126834847 n=1 Tax=Adelges cooleyi TaxID=133065 RepID=UPI00217FFCF0|nr:uncharacterized protein LOC126834847 [Adelges cooleyi]
MANLQPKVEEEVQQSSKFHVLPLPPNLQPKEEEEVQQSSSELFYQKKQHIFQSTHITYLQPKEEEEPQQPLYSKGEKSKMPTTNPETSAKSDYFLELKQRRQK